MFIGREREASFGGKHCIWESRSRFVVHIESADGCHCSARKGQTLKICGGARYKILQLTGIAEMLPISLLNGRLYTSE